MVATRAATPRRALRYIGQVARVIQPEGMIVMAKGQMKSNKEVKKPKKEKLKPATDASSMTARLTAAQDKAKGPKK